MQERHIFSQQLERAYYNFFSQEAHVSGDGSLIFVIFVVTLEQQLNFSVTSPVILALQWLVDFLMKDIYKRFNYPRGPPG